MCNKTPIRASHCRRQPAKGKRRGAVSVEFALCASIFFMFAFGSFEFARFLFARHAVDQAAYEAARVGIVPGKTAAQVQTRALQALQAAGIRQATVVITPQVFTTTTETVTVEVRCPFRDNSWIPPTFLRGATLQSQITLDHENQAYLNDQSITQTIGDNTDEPRDI